METWACGIRTSVECSKNSMQCPLCSHPKAHKHGRTSKGSQRYRCLNCQQTFTDTFDTIYYRR